MNKQQTNQMASLRKKLMAAIAMLLVACIMTVSSTYAWFTLSTAPEIRGISTTIGANGNLEMALGTYQNIHDASYPQSYVGSSMANANQDIADANITWGNLVDLGYTGNTYGLDKIALFPSRLNANGTNLNRTSPLQFPKYGADGRVTELSDGTLVGAYDSVGGGFIYTPGTGNESYGVSGVGSASSMSKREFAVMNYQAAITSNKSAAINAAKDAIRLYGGELAAIALKYQNVSETDAATTKVPEADITVLKNLIAKLQQSNNAISDSMKSAVLLALTSANTINDGNWEILVGLANGKDIAAYISALDEASAATGFEMPAAISTELVGKYNAIQDKIDAATAALPESGDGTWANIKGAVNSLLVASGIEIGGYTLTQIKQDYTNGGMSSPTVKDLFNKVSDGSLSYTFTKDSGIFADIALLTGEYTSSMAFPEGTIVEGADGLDLNMLGSKPVKVESASSSTAQGDIGVMYAVLKDLEYNPGDDSDAVKPLTDTYGYIIDLLFRTNATESDLLLQVDGTDRIYGDDGIEETKGHGSNMTFTVNAEYTQEKIERLAEGIRVVFFDNANDILAVATLADGKLSGDAYKMELQLRTYTISNEGVITFTGVQADNKICALTANVKTAVSALVYLDGDVIDNADAGVTDGLEAMLNLQFASSVELTPMENADLNPAA